MTHAMLTKILINLSIILIMIIGVIIWLKKVDFTHKGYKYLFIVYIFFWIPPMMLRAYAGTVQKLINLDFTWIVLAAYGLVGIFARTFADWINFSFRSRKAFLYIAIICQIAMYIPLLIKPTTATNIIQSVGVGIGASCIGSFQLLFKEQYNREKTYLTISLLSIPPLIANFLTAPIQSIFMAASKVQTLNNLDVLKWMWMVGIGICLLTFIMLYFLREDKTRFDTIKSLGKFNVRQDSLPYALLLIIGLVICFIKFSLSGSVATLHLQTLASYQNLDVTGFEGYLSVVFSVFELGGAILVGTILVKRLKTTTIFLIGAITWFIYLVLYISVKNAIAYFVLHGLVGFGYGLLYNLILGRVLAKRFNSNIITPMGIYQSVLATGIASSGIFTQFLKNNLKTNNFWFNNRMIGYTLMAVLVIVTGLYFLNYYIEKRNELYRPRPFTIGVEQKS